MNWLSGVPKQNQASRVSQELFKEVYDGLASSLTEHLTVFIQNTQRTCSDQF